MSGRRSGLVLPALLALAAGCAGERGGAAKEDAMRVPSYAYDPSEPSAGFGAAGRLRVEGGCVYVEMEAGRRRLLFPEGEASLSEDGTVLTFAGVALRDGDGIDFGASRASAADGAGAACGDEPALRVSPVGFAKVG